NQPKHIRCITMKLNGSTSKCIGFNRSGDFSRKKGINPHEDKTENFLSYKATLAPQVTKTSRNAATHQEGSVKVKKGNALRRTGNACGWTIGSNWELSSRQLDNIHNLWQCLRLNHLKSRTASQERI